jgi:hypothetical protein
MQTSACPASEFVDATRQIVEDVIWCTVSTVDTTQSPRSRLMHPVWCWEGDVPVGLVTARTTPIKIRHLEHRPVVSCFYWNPSHHTVAIDATATWLAPAAKLNAWEAIREVPAPVGFDPAMIWPDGPSADDCGILRLDPYRIVTTRAGQPQQLWRRERRSPNNMWPDPR